MTRQRCFFDPLLIRASAGTGKTFALSSRYIKLLAAGETPDKILATTFTRKAAGEIQSRVFQRLAKAASSDQNALELSEQMKLSGFDSKTALSTLQALIKNQHRLNICTLDSFFFKIASSFSLELGLMPGWKISDPAQDSSINGQVVADLCRGKTGESLVALMNLLNQGNWRRPVQSKIESVATSLHSLFRQTREEAWTWLKPQKSLERKSQEAALEKLKALVEQNDTKTFGKRALGAVRNSIELFEERDWDAFIGNGLPASLCSDGLYYGKPVPEEVCSSLMPLVEHARSQLIARLSALNRGSYELLKLYDQQYEALRSASATLSFSDVKAKLSSASVFEARDLSEVYYRLDSAIHHLLLDEFQDTSASEWFVIKPLSDEILSSEPDQHSFFCVGDVKQAIYGWRGGKSEIFDHLEQHYELKKQSTETSYRSSQAVIDTVNQVFSYIETNPALSSCQGAAEEWKKGFAEHKTKKQELPGYCRLEAVPCGEDASAAKAAATVAKRAALLIKELTELAPALEIGVLCRKNSSVARIRYELSKEEIGIPSSEEGGTYLSDSPAVTMFISLLKLADHPGDTVSRYHVSISPLARLVSLKDFSNDQEAQALSLKLKKRFTEDGYGPVIMEWAREILPLCSPRDGRRLMQLVDLAHAFDQNPSSRTTEFINYILETKVEDPSQSNVRVMTFHQSKGLEFDICILPELDFSMTKQGGISLLTWYEEQELTPSLVSRGTKAGVRALSKKLEDMYAQTRNAEIKESLCLLYVALTRAKHANYMLVKDGGRQSTSWAQVIKNALGETDSSIKFETGDPQWYRKIESKVSGELPAEPLLAPIKLKAPEVPAIREFPRKSPSALEGNAVFDSKKALTLHGRGAREKGILVHAFFSRLEWLENADLSNQNLEAVAHSAGIRDQKLIAAASLEFLRALEKPEIKALLLKPASKVCVETELPFAFIDGEAILQGTFDRLHVEKTESGVSSVTILDFKTDRVEASDKESLNSRVQYYLPQMEAYRKAASALYKIPASKVSGKLLFTNSGLAVTVF